MAHMGLLVRRCSVCFMLRRNISSFDCIPRSAFVTPLRTNNIFYQPPNLAVVFILDNPEGTLYTLFSNY
jgi:hypothetical protein